MPTPALAHVLRGERLESLHRGDVAVADAQGHLLAWSGNPRREVYLRSAAKPFQALPLLVGGGQRAFALSSAEIAVMCASHGGEPRHIRAVAALLSKGGFTVKDLRCGAHEPMDGPAARALLGSGRRPTALHNNCSGKHAGILLACRLGGHDTADYWNPDHPIQRRILSVVSEFCGVVEDRIGIGIDGCGLPVFFLSLAGLARGYARLLAGRLPEEGPRDRAARRLAVASMGKRPEMVAGTGRFTTALIDAGGGRWIGKEGAEGLYAIGCAAVGGAGAIGIAFKIEDGSSRSRDAVALEILDRLGKLTPRTARRLCAYRRPTVRNVAGREVGRIEPVVALRISG